MFVHLGARSPVVYNLDLWYENLLSTGKKITRLFGKVQPLRHEWRFQVSGIKDVKSLFETTFHECGSRNVECGRMESLRSVFF